MLKNIVKFFVVIIMVIISAVAAIAAPNTAGMMQTIGNCSTIITDAYGKQNIGNGKLFMDATGRICFCFENGTYNAWLTNTNAIINGTNYTFDANSYGWPNNNNVPAWNGNSNWNNNNYTQTGWSQDSRGWRYYDNSYVTGWRQINYNGRTAWYYFDSSGYMTTGWKEIYYQGRYNWYYFGSDGAMRTNTNIDGYRIGSDGVALNKGSSGRCDGPSSHSYDGPGSSSSSTKTWCEHCGKKTYGANMCMTCGYTKSNYCPNGCDPTKNKYCRYCGNKFPSTSVNYCDKCHRAVDEGDEDNYRYCGNCGTRLNRNRRYY